jgi:hypothetical protein
MRHGSVVSIVACVIAVGTAAGLAARSDAPITAAGVESVVGPAPAQWQRMVVTGEWRLPDGHPPLRGSMPLPRDGMLPPDHPPIMGGSAPHPGPDLLELPPGHPPIQPRVLPPGHPPVAPRGLPPGHTPGVPHGCPGSGGAPGVIEENHDLEVVDAPELIRV